MIDFDILTYMFLASKREKELTIAKIKKLLPQLANIKTGPILDIHEEPQFNDEPKIARFSAKLFIKTKLKQEKHPNIEYAGGTSFDRLRTLIKTIGESVERHSLAQYESKSLINGSQTTLTNTMDLQSLAGVPEDQNLNNHEFLWVRAKNLFDSKQCFVPAQLVFVPYVFGKGEPILRLPITTGAASGTSLHGALYRGICESIERDAFMIFYLNKLPVPRVRTGNNKTLSKIEEYLRRYLLDLFIFEITTDIGIPTMLAIIIDKTGKGPAVSVGAKTSLNPIRASVGAIEEALHTRLWVRGEMFKKYNLHQIEANSEEIASFRERGLFWSSLPRIKDLSFLLKHTLFKSIGSNKENKDQQINLKLVLNKLKLRNLDGFYVEVTTPRLKKLGFSVVKVIIPKLQPLYLHENRRCWLGERLFTVPRILGYKVTGGLNKIPHPFL